MAKFIKWPKIVDFIAPSPDQYSFKKETFVLPFKRIFCWICERENFCCRRRLHWLWQKWSLLIIMTSCNPFSTDASTHRRLVQTTSAHVFLKNGQFPASFSFISSVFSINETILQVINANNFQLVSGTNDHMSPPMATFVYIISCIRQRS